MSRKAKRMKESDNRFWIVITIIIIVVSIMIVLLPNLIIPWKEKDDQDKSNYIQYRQNIEKVEIVEIQKEENAETTVEQAKEATVMQFKNLGEEVAQEELKIDLVERKGEKYYLIKSKEHSIMINVQTGKIFRIDSVSL